MSLANTSGFHSTDKTGPSTESRYPLIKRDMPVSSSRVVELLERRKKAEKDSNINNKLLLIGLTSLDKCQKTQKVLPEHPLLPLLPSFHLSVTQTMPALNFCPVLLSYQLQTQVFFCWDSEVGHCHQGVLLAWEWNPFGISHFYGRLSENVWDVRRQLLLWIEC